MTNPELAPDMPDNRYRKKPVVIDAMQFPGNIALSDFQTWLMKVDPDRKCMYTRDDRNRCTLSIKTLEGTMTANIDDWIIKGVKGELYPCKPDIFEATYERADLTPQAGSVDVEAVIDAVTSFYTRKEDRNFAAQVARNTLDNLLAGAPVGGGERPAIPGLQEAIDGVAEYQQLRQRCGFTKKITQHISVVLEAARRYAALPHCPDGYPTLDKAAGLEALERLHKQCYGNNFDARKAKEDYETIHAYISLRK